MQSVGVYQLEAVLGEGTMGTVYRARDPDGTLVALKLLSPRAPLERFEVEARALARVCHPGVPKVVEFGTHPTVFLAMEYVEGRPLQDLIGEPWPASAALDLIEQLLPLLSALHAAGVVHRDLSPRNLLLDDKNRLHLVDFGVARLDLDQQLTLAGEVLGSVEYMAPEQISTQLGPIGPATDLYAAATLLYRLLAHSLPFPRGSYPRMVRHILGSPPQRLAVFSDPLWAFLERGLAKEPAQRYGDAPEMSAALRLVRKSGEET